MGRRGTHWGRTRRPPRALPLSRQGSGHWTTRDGVWTFLRHHSDPHPQRWFTYERGDAEACWPAGHLSLHDAVAAVAAEPDS